MENSTNHFTIWRYAVSRSIEINAYVFKTIGAFSLLAISAIIQAAGAADFDINRYSTAGAGWFKTFHVGETQDLRTALADGKIAEEMMILVTETAAGRLALIKDQMAYHHIAQGTAAGSSWMVTF